MIGCRFGFHRWGGKRTQYLVPTGYMFDSDPKRMTGTICLELCLFCDIAKCAWVEMSAQPTIYT